ASPTVPGWLSLRSRACPRLRCPSPGEPQRSPVRPRGPQAQPWRSPSFWGAMGAHTGGARAAHAPAFPDGTARQNSSGSDRQATVTPTPPPTLSPLRGGGARLYISPSGSPLLHGEGAGGEIGEIVPDREPGLRQQAGLIAFRGQKPLPQETSARTRFGFRPRSAPGAPENEDVTPAAEGRPPDA